MKTESVRIDSDLLARVRQIAIEQRRSLPKQVAIMLEVAFEKLTEPSTPEPADIPDDGQRV